MKPQPVQTMRGPKAGTAMCSLYRSTLSEAVRWQAGQDTATDANVTLFTPLAALVIVAMGLLMQFG